MYEDAMDNLAYNAVEEVSIDSNGNSHTSNPTKWKILGDARTYIVSFLKNNIVTIKEYDSLKAYAVTYLKRIVDINLELYGPVIVAYEPSYKATLDQKIKKNKLKKIVLLVVVVAIFVACVVAGALS